MRQMRISNNQKYLLIGVAFGLGIVLIADSYNPTYVLASVGPTSNTITTKLTDSLKSITSNISTSVQDTVDEVIADTMDVLIENTMSKLENATIYDNSDTSNVKFEPKVPSGIDMSQSSN
jgi:methionine synthase I (cobalamin-dependent)